jgi:RND family efflux transporter MFP subunit
MAQKEMRFLKLIAVICAAAWLMAVAATALAQGGPVPVVVSIASERLLAPVTSYPGTVISRNQARLAAEVEGRIEWVAEVGVVVRKGEIVARLDDVLLEHSLLADKAAVERERARLEYQNAEVRRLTPLVIKQSVPQSQLDEAIANSGMTKAEIAAGKARVALTRERLKRANLRAPFDGVITERVLQAGEWAESGAAVVRLVDTSSLEVQTWVPVNALNFVREGSALTLAGNPNNTIGTVRTIVPVGDNRSRLYELRLTFDNDGWPVGADVRVAVPTARARRVLAIPRDALVLRRDGKTVYRIDAEGLAQRVPVTTGIAVGGLIEVDGIQSGDRVVTRGGERLRPGQSVTVIERTELR